MKRKSKKQSEQFSIEHKIKHRHLVCWLKDIIDICVGNRSELEDKDKRSLPELLILLQNTNSNLAVREANAWVKRLKYSITQLETKMKTVSFEHSMLKNKE